MKQKKKSKDSKIRVADLILIIASIVLIFFSFVGYLMTSEGDWLTAAILTICAGGFVALLITFMIFAKKQTDHVLMMRICEGVSLVIYIAFAIVMAIVPINQAFITMGASNKLSGAIDSDIKSLNESRKQFFDKEQQNIELASSTIKNVSGIVNLSPEDKADVEKTMKLKSGQNYWSQSELQELSKDYEERFAKKLNDKSFAANDLGNIVKKAEEMKRDVDAGFFFTYTDIARQMDGLSDEMANLQSEKSKELGIRSLEKDGAKYKAPLLSSVYEKAYEKSEFSTKLYGLHENSIIGICIGFIAMLLLLAVYLAEPRAKRVNPNKKTTGGISLKN